MGFFTRCHTRVVGSLRIWIHLFLVVDGVAVRLGMYAARTTTCATALASSFSRRTLKEEDTLLRMFSFDSAVLTGVQDLGRLRRTRRAIPNFNNGSRSFAIVLV